MKKNLFTLSGETHNFGIDTAKNPELWGNGAKLTKYALGIEGANRRDRGWGRVKVAGRLALASMLFVKGMQEASEFIAGGIDARYATNYEDNVAEISDRWTVLASVGAYTVSRLARYLQHSARDESSFLQENLVNDPDVGVREVGDFSNGALAVLGEAHSARIFSDTVSSHENAESTDWRSRVLHSGPTAIPEKPTEWSEV